MSDMTEPRGDKMDSYRLGLWLGALGRCKQVCEGLSHRKSVLGWHRERGGPWGQGGAP